MKKEILGFVMHSNQSDIGSTASAFFAFPMGASAAAKPHSTAHTGRKPRLRATTAMALAAVLGFSFAGPLAGAAATSSAGDDLEKSFIIAAQESYGTSVPAVSGVSAEAAETSQKKNPWLIGAGMALILGALVKLIGANRVMNLAAEAGPALQKTAETLAEAPKAAARAVGAAMTTPLRYVMLIGGLAMIGFTGISFFDLEWGAGILTGIGMTAVTWAGSARLGKVFRRQRVPVRARTKPDRQASRAHR